eukprot:5407494-Amphidinium_carterae.1
MQVPRCACLHLVFSECGFARRVSREGHLATNHVQAAARFRQRTSMERCIASASTGVTKVEYSQCGPTQLSDHSLSCLIPLLACDGGCLSNCGGKRPTCST